MKFISILSGFFLVASSAIGAIIAADGFDYTASSTVTNSGTGTAEQIGGVDLNGGTGWTSSWIHQGFGSPSADTTAGSYAYSDGVNSVATSGVAYNLRSFRNSSRTFGALADGTYYFSIMIDRNQSDNAGNAKLKFVQTGSQNRAFEVGFLDGNNNLDYRIGGASEVQDAATGVDRVNFIVGSFELSGGTTGSLSLWLNPTDLGNMAANTAISTTGTSGGGIDGIRLEYGSGANGGRFDEFRLGTSWADVTTVPEPGTFALLAGLVALGGIMLRRRMRD